MIQLMLVEDDPVLSRSVSVSLEMESYKVFVAHNLQQADKINASESIDLVVLDLGLPDGSGLDFLKKIRQAGSRLPILILTAQTDEESVVNGLELGASDYMKKPFSQRELLARIRNILREPSMREEQVRYGDLLVLTEARKILYKEQTIELNRREYDAFLYLVQQAEKIVTREQLLNFLDKEGEIFDRTIDSHISHIRAKLRKLNVESIKISSVYGIGYRLEKQ